MTDVHTTEQPTSPKRRRYKRRTAAPRLPKMPEEFAGLSVTDCCNACVGNQIEAAKAQKRIDEIDGAFPRIPSRAKNSPTVMESDAEWLARNPIIADEWKRLAPIAQGKCAISGAQNCAHPLKGGLSPQQKNDPRALERHMRAKKLLARQKLDLTGA